MPLTVDDIRALKPGAKGPWGKLKEERVAVCIHYDASLSDEGAWRWLLKDPRCKVSYNRLVLDDGTDVLVAPENARAYHAGVCRPSENVPLYKDANSALYGLAFAATKGDTITEAQLTTAVAIAAMWMKRHGWTDVDRHITDHAAEAWPRGRKTDITGLKGVTLEEFRAAVAKVLK
jgi:N-acetyl-anhydromuramyl-L-alanine amidase AmpD